MTHRPHDLPAEFPDMAANIARLKHADAHFARLATEYDEVNDMIHRAETNIAPVDDLAMIGLRKQRGHLKDEIYALLKAAQPTS
ncbi:YdcH family protein [Pseudooceanicola nanhaiensis]|jgi:uncharacterized protein YdcH (DUF465 family)|uniref:DUF465 domain-containing protein n=1 Tax=Pseudooceanicola nanhaiensis TaxID=375761 RepID=A0A917SM98_9RHOB|nr:YdcH family protein [Pseudooceanicola nanhaiensis]GGL85835.1 hypothetical protein GCM10011534_04680 [Pseudooceanicola nanhaiensis]